MLYFDFFDALFDAVMTQTFFEERSMYPRGFLGFNSTIPVYSQ